ncbi:MAG: hypothetical protein HC842_08295 [Cytophagales bacterium]|nr:hypothetical protein [Cytophagales bacterium]
MKYLILLLLGTYLWACNSEQSEHTRTLEVVVNPTDSFEFDTNELILLPKAKLPRSFEVYVLKSYPVPRGYDTTFISSYEFYWDRILFIDCFDSELGFYKGFKGKNMQHEIFNLYADNIDKPIWHADSLMMLKINEVCKQNPNICPCDTTRCDCFVWGPAFITFRKWIDKRQTGPDFIPTYGINLDNKDALQQLLDSGLSVSDAKKAIWLKPRTRFSS